MIQLLTRHGGVTVSALTRDWSDMRPVHAELAPILLLDQPAVAGDRKAGEDVLYIRLSINMKGLDRLSPIALRWSIPAVDVQGLWHPLAERARGLVPDWWSRFGSSATSNAPVLSLFSGAGRNRLTYAFSDALYPLGFKSGLNEESACFHCEIALFEDRPLPFGDCYEALLRLDFRDISYAQALQSAAAWWETLAASKPAPVPETALLPMYSTWYSFHQQLEPGAIEEQALLARQLGCAAIIVDDGWQTSDEARGYAYCGDWRVSPSKIPDMKAHVARVHAAGMKYLLWYSVPFVGKHSEAWSRFAGKLLHFNEEWGAGILDPRFPEVRQYLIGLYEQALVEWDLDGFKLDFVDSFHSGGSELQYGHGRDTDSVSVATDLLLSETLERLRCLKPDVMIEFRQGYIGPLMRKYGNMLRAGDCPADAVTNRVKTIDLRLLGGGTAIHADMLMWHSDESAESAMLQLINVLFSVPQISMLLDRLPSRHVSALVFWLAFWREHRDVLLGGELEPLHPELLYPLIFARTNVKWLAVAYQDAVIVLADVTPGSLIMLVNGTSKRRLIIEAPHGLGRRQIRILNCEGDLQVEYETELTAGLHAVAVPPSGVAYLAL